MNLADRSPFGVPSHSLGRVRYLELSLGRRPPSMLSIGKDYPALPICSEEKWVVVELRSESLDGMWVIWHVDLF